MIRHRTMLIWRYPQARSHFTKYNIEHLRRAIHPKAFQVSRAVLYTYFLVSQERLFTFSFCKQSSVYCFVVRASKWHVTQSSSSRTRSRRSSSLAQSMPLPAIMAATTLFMIRHLALDSFASPRRPSSRVRSSESSISSIFRAFNLPAKSSKVRVKSRFFAMCVMLWSSVVERSLRAEWRLEDRLV